MIFVTVGAHMPFDRLTRCVDAWAGAQQRRDVFAQIGTTGWKPVHMEWTAALDPLEFRERLAAARAVVTHAGMGTILTALEFGKPVIVMPRCARRRETRNDHQQGTARIFTEGGRVTVAWNEGELVDLLHNVDRLPAPPRLGSHPSIGLIDTLREFIRCGARPGTGHPVRTIPFAPPADAPAANRKRAA